MQNQSRDAFPSDTKKNSKDCMAITLRSGKSCKVEIKLSKSSWRIEMKVEIRAQQAVKRSKEKVSYQVRAIC